MRTAIAAAKRGLQIDHITPLAQGGETTEDNLRLLCAHHNRREAAKRIGTDEVAALRWMGISLDEAQLAAERTKDLADGSTGKRVMVARRFCSTRFGRKQDFRRKPDDARPASPPAGANDHAA